MITAGVKTAEVARESAAAAKAHEVMIFAATMARVAPAARPIKTSAEVLAEDSVDQDRKVSADLAARVAQADEAEWAPAGQVSDLRVRWAASAVPDKSKSALRASNASSTCCCVNRIDKQTAPRLAVLMHVPMLIARVVAKTARNAQDVAPAEKAPVPPLVQDLARVVWAGAVAVYLERRPAKAEALMALAPTAPALSSSSAHGRLKVAEADAVKETADHPETMDRAVSAAKVAQTEMLRIQ